MQRVELSRTPKPSHGTGGYGGSSYRDNPARGGSYAGSYDSYRRERR